MVIESLYDVITSPMKMLRAAERRLSTNADMLADWMLSASERDEPTVVDEVGLPPADAGALLPKVNQRNCEAEQENVPVKKAKTTSSSAKSSMRKANLKSRENIKVKQEPMRDMPFRSSRACHKSGFYSESNLTALAWRGDGSQADPIRFL